MQDTRSGFFSSLYDLSFHRFITPRIVSVVYAIALVILGIYAFIFLVSGFQTSYTFLGASTPGAGTIVWHLLGAPVIFIVGSIGARLYLEIVVAVFRIAENTAREPE